MENEEPSVIRLARSWYHIVSDIFDHETWKKICLEFTKYDNIDKYLLPFSICDLISTSKKIKRSDNKLSGLQLILFTSIIESISARVDFITFPEWYKNIYKKEELIECHKIYQKYERVYGSGKYVKNFFRDVIDENDKLNLLLKLRKNITNDEWAPFCFQSIDECFYRTKISRLEGGKIIERYLGRSPDCNGVGLKTECPALKDQTIMRSGLTKFTEYLYAMRNKFVHKAIMPMFTEYMDEPTGGPIINLNSTLISTDKKNISDVEYNIYQNDLKYDDLHKLLIKYLPCLFDKYLNEVN